MQVTNTPAGFEHREFFTGPSDAALHGEMDRRRRELEAEGHTFVRRTKIGRNTTCPCGSGRKFKKCCLVGAKVINTR